MGVSDFSVEVGVLLEKVVDLLLKGIVLLLVGRDLTLVVVQLLKDLVVLVS